MTSARSIPTLAAMLAPCAHCLPAQCVPTAGGYYYDPLGCIGPPPGGSQCAPNASPICAQGEWTGVTFPDGWSPSYVPYVAGNGQGVTCYNGCQQASETCYNPQTYSCPPTFGSAVSPGAFTGYAYDQTATITRLQCGVVQFNAYALRSNNTAASRYTVVPHTCACTGSPAFMCSVPADIGYVSPTCQNGQFTCAGGAYQCPMPPPGYCGGGYVLSCTENGWMCMCEGGCGSCPIIIDTQNQGFHLTDWEHGVTFGFFPDQAPIQLAWTDASYSNGWLALDRDGNGLIDNGTELFGNITPQPPSATPNGFLALAVFDDPANGGNGNGFIDPGDAVYSHLLVWIDANHDGISQPDELKTLPELGIFRIDLQYHNSPFVDRYGNQFRYRGTDWDDAGNSRQACYDVFLTHAPGN
jgi:hypothetical protein